MRMLINIAFPIAEFNALVAKGTIGQTIKSILDDQKPEAVYFTEMHGGRGMVMVIDIPGPSHVAIIAEPWFLKFKATMEFRIVMSSEELGSAGLDALGKKWSG